MTVKQIAELVNTSTKEVLGEVAIQTEDLSNVVDIGKQIADANAVDNYVKSLVDHIGKVIFVNRKYNGNVPSVLKDAWEYGSILEKIDADIPEAKENDSWKLTNGTDYSPNVFYKPTVTVKFYNSKTTFEVAMSFTEKQVKESFNSADQLNGFISMLYNSVDKSMSVKMDSLIMSTINNATATVMNANFASVKDGNYSASTSTQAVNLLKLYNDKMGLTASNALTASKALADKDFLKFASMTIGLYKDRLGKMSTLFNVGNKARFTPADSLHIVALSDFMASLNSYLEADTFHNELVKLPNGIETVPYWQGSGTDYGFDSVSNIHINIKNGDSTAEVNAKGILAVMFDNDAVGVTNEDRRVTTQFNPRAEFVNSWFKFDCSYFNDMNENFVVFFIA